MPRFYGVYKEADVLRTLEEIAADKPKAENPECILATAPESKSDEWEPVCIVGEMLDRFGILGPVVEKVGTDAMAILDEQRMWGELTGPDGRNLFTPAAVRLMGKVQKIADSAIEGGESHRLGAFRTVPSDVSRGHDRPTWAEAVEWAKGEAPEPVQAFL